MTFIVISIGIGVAFFFFQGRDSNSDESQIKLEIKTPKQNALLPAGYIPISWSLNDKSRNSQILNSAIYINSELIKSTYDLSYIFYTTEVKYYTLKIIVELDNGDILESSIYIFGVTKKGICVNSYMGRFLDLKKFNIGWYYNWDYQPSSGSQYNNIEFVPILWGSDTDVEVCQKIKILKVKYRYVLAYNDPDRPDQCNKSVDEVFAQYKKCLINNNILLSAPATSAWPSKSEWFQNFDKKVKEDSEVDYDFISLHVFPENYAGAEAALWLINSVVDDTYQTYGKPIWLTEFSTNGTRISESSTIEFYKTLIPLLNERPYVIRYSPYNFHHVPQSLFDQETGELTSVGKAYADLGNPQRS